MQATTNLIDYTLPQIKSTWVRNATLMLIGSLLLAISSKFQLPMPPVPFTMQSYVVLVLGMVMGARLAGATVLLYLFEGALGLPVFASGAGMAYMTGPTGGYLVGFFVAAVAVGHLSDMNFDRKLLTALLAMAIGTALIFIPGVLWMSHLFGMEKALNLGLHPFWFGMIFKLVLGALTLPLAWRLLGK